MQIKKLEDDFKNWPNLIILKKPALSIVVILISLLFVPDLSGEVLVNQMSFTFLHNFSSTGFYLMLSVLSFIWAFLSFSFDAKEFRARSLLANILIIPLLIFAIVVIALIFARILSVFGNSLFYVYKVLDILVLSIFLFLLYKKLNKFFLSNPTKDNKFRISILNNLCIAAFFAFIALPNIRLCKSMECRNAELKSALDSEVYNVVENYIKSSQVITNDIGEVKEIANVEGAKVLVTVWLDYDAQMSIEVKGEKGVGFLDLTIAGNNFKSLEHFKGTWKYANTVKLIGVDGKIDEATTKYQLLKEREQELENSTDCTKTLALIEQNQQESKAGKAYEFNYLKTSKIQAECSLQLGNKEKAAEAFAQYSYHTSPFAFQETKSDKPKVDEAKAAILKAMELNPNYKYFDNWKLQLEKINIQESLTLNPCDENLRSSLRDVLARSRVFYKTIPGCKRE